MRTPKQIINQTEKLAYLFYSLQGYNAKKNFKFRTATHPHEHLCWQMACAAQLELTETDIRDVLEELDE